MGILCTYDTGGTDQRWLPTLKAKIEGMRSESRS